MHTCEFGLYNDDYDDHDEHGHHHNNHGRDHDHHADFKMNDVEKNATAEKEEKDAVDGLPLAGSSDKQSVVDPGETSSEDSQAGTTDQTGAVVEASDVESAAIVKASANGSSKAAATALGEAKKKTESNPAAAKKVAAKVENPRSDEVPEAVVEIDCSSFETKEARKM